MRNLPVAIRGEGHVLKPDVELPRRRRHDFVHPPLALHVRYHLQKVALELGIALVGPVAFALAPLLVSSRDGQPLHRVRRNPFDAYLFEGAFILQLCLQLVLALAQPETKRHDDVGDEDEDYKYNTQARPSRPLQSSEEIIYA